MGVKDSILMNWSGYSKQTLYVTEELVKVVPNLYFPTTELAVVLTWYSVGLATGRTQV